MTTPDDNPEHTETMIIPVVVAKSGVLTNLFERYSSRKFVACTFCEVIASVGLFDGKIDQHVWFETASMILAIYFGASVTDKKLNGGSG